MTNESRIEKIKATVYYLLGADGDELEAKLKYDEVAENAIGELAQLLTPSQDVPTRNQFKSKVHSLYPNRLDMKIKAPLDKEVWDEFVEDIYQLFAPHLTHQSSQVDIGEIRKRFEKYVGDSMSWGAKESILGFFLPYLTHPAKMEWAGTEAGGGNI